MSKPSNSEENKIELLRQLDCPCETETQENAKKVSKDARALLQESRQVLQNSLQTSLLGTFCVQVCYENSP